nr:hypothetical protein [Desulfobacterales bacterium]
MLDVSVSYNRYRFLGAEFLTWVWYVIERDRGQIKVPENMRGILTVGNRVVIENSRNDTVQQITIRGDNADMGEGMLALKKGGLATKLSLEYTLGEQEWRFTLKGDSLDVTGLKTPTVAPVETSDEIEGAALEKTALCEVVIDLVDALFNRFIKLRVSDDWENEVVPKIRKWIMDAKT